MEKKIEIVFVIQSMHSGGSERVMLHLLKNLDRQKFSITFILLNKEGALVPYLPGDIHIISYNFKRTLTSAVQLYKVLRQLKPQIVFSTLNQVNLLISLLIPFLPKKTIFIARESSIVTENNKNDRYPALFRFLYNTSFNRFHSIICQSVSMKDDLLKNFRIDEKKITIINNPVDMSLLPGPSAGRRKDAKVSLISVGRLRKEKGYERIINALAKCKAAFHYRIIGDGPLRDDLQKQIDALDLADKVMLLGEIPMPYNLVSESDLFLQGSYYEGFPNAVIEANACGVPVAAWSAPGGHNEIIFDGVNGWKFNNADELCELIAAGEFLSVNRNAITALTRQRYDLARIVLAYEGHFSTLVG